MKIELHYHTGGHGGPYADQLTAIGAAIRLLRGSVYEKTIDLRDGVNGPLIASVSKADNGFIVSTKDWTYNVLRTR